MFRVATNRCQKTLLFRISRLDRLKFPSASRSQTLQICQIRSFSFDPLKFVTGTSSTYRDKLMEPETQEFQERIMEMYTNGESVLNELGLLNWWDPFGSAFRYCWEHAHLVGGTSIWASILGVCFVSEVLIFSWGVLQKVTFLKNFQLLNNAHYFISNISHYFYAFSFARMNYADYPGLTHGGFLWLKDLTVSDPYLVLPLTIGGIYFLSYHLSRHSRERYEIIRWENRNNKFMYNFSFFMLCLSLAGINTGIATGISTGGGLCILTGGIMGVLVNLAYRGHKSVNTLQSNIANERIAYERNKTQKQQEELIRATLKKRAVNDPATNRLVQGVNKEVKKRQ